MVEQYQHCCGGTGPTQLWWNSTKTAVVELYQHSYGGTVPKLLWRNWTNTVMAEQYQNCCGRTRPTQLWWNSTNTAVVELDQHSYGGTVPKLLWWNCTNTVMVEQYQNCCGGTCNNTVMVGPGTIHSYWNLHQHSCYRSVQSANWLIQSTKLNSHPMDRSKHPKKCFTKAAVVAVFTIETDIAAFKMIFHTSKWFQNHLYIYSRVTWMLHNTIETTNA